MIYNIYSVRDDKTGFATPFVDMNDESAARGFAFAFHNNSNLMVFSPADFRLYKIGSFNSDDGSVASERVPILICDGASLRPSSFNEVSCDA